MNIFSGVKIIDLTRVFSGPFATLHFAEYGAEVIKIEPLYGDDSRYFPPMMGNWSGYFEILNHNKKSLFLDLKNKNDLNKLYSLSKDADVLVENFSANVKKRLKINYEHIIKTNPKIIYASINGISDDIDRKYYDAIAQAESGLISLNGEDDDMKISTSIVDAFSGMKLAFAISTALYYREKTGKGQKLSVSMKGSAFDLLEQNLISSFVTGRNPEKVGNMDNAIAPFGLFKTNDGQIMLAIGNNSIWDSFSTFLCKENPNFKKELFLTNSLRLSSIKLLKNQIELAFNKYSTEEILKMLHDLNVPCGKVNKMSDVLEDQENFNQKLLLKVRHSKAGEIVVSTGGIKYSLFDPENYKESPQLE